MHFPSSPKQRKIQVCSTVYLETLTVFVSETQEVTTILKQIFPREKRACCQNQQLMTTGWAHKLESMPAKRYGSKQSNLCYSLWYFFFPQPALHLVPRYRIGFNSCSTCHPVPTLQRR